MPPMESAGELIDLELTDVERTVLAVGLNEWGGPARVTEEFACAMGFRDQADMFGESQRIMKQLGRGEPLAALDWARTVLATEVVFASDLVGSGRDWTSTTGFSDVDTIELLRTIQGKLPRIVRTVIGAEFGTRPPGRFH